MNSLMIKRISLLACGVLTLASLNAQNNLNQEVTVVKPYEPTVGDAFKINQMPNIVDTNKMLNKFDYKLFPKQYPVIYNVTPIQPAKMVAESINKLYKTNIKFGYGLYNTLLGQVAVNTVRSKDYTGGLWLNHYSSRGNIKLDNDFKSPAFYSRNQAEVYGKKFLENATVYGNGYFDRTVLHQYGYRTSPDTLFNYNYTKDTTKQSYTTFGTKIGYRTTYLDSSKINHSAELRYNYLEDKFSNFQHNLHVMGSGSFLYRNQFVGADVNIDWNNISTSLDTNNKALVSIFPWVRFFGETWRINCGLAMEVDAYSDSTFYHFYPRADIQYNVIENFLIPFAGFDGKMISNTLQSTYLENPYMKPGLQMKNTNQLMKIFAGFKGNFSRQISYLLQVNYSLYDNLPFFINDSLMPEDDFIYVYDGVKGKETQEVKFNGELAYKLNQKLNVILSGNYYKYTLEHLDKPYQRPEWDLTFTTRYNMRDKITTQLDIFSIGTRYAYDYFAPKTPIKLSPIVDANLSFDYHYSKLFGAFLRFNNLLNKNYSYWNHYPVQRLQVLFGISLTM